MNNAYSELGWIAAGVIAWYGVRIYSPKVAGLILAAIVIGILMIVAPKLATVGN